ncbi:MAG: HEPN domain-containing protein [Lachnospiraceae bacterium]|nr:HEPN domain-containing protein [Lachnospiraceae bacterium]
MGRCFAVLSECEKGGNCTVESSLTELSKYRLQTAVEDLDSAIALKEIGQYKSSINRSYYAIFHALRAVTAMDGFDSSKHSGVIAYFNKNYVKEGIFDKEISKLIDTSFRLREKADYQDFFVVSKSQAEEQIGKAERVIGLIKHYLEKRCNNE